MARYIYDGCQQMKVVITRRYKRPTNIDFPDDFSSIWKPEIAGRSCGLFPIFQLSSSSNIYFKKWKNVCRWKKIA
jgi:hypothetical protein